MKRVQVIYNIVFAIGGRSHAITIFDEQDGKAVGDGRRYIHPRKTDVLRAARHEMSKKQCIAVRRNMQEGTEAVIDFDGKDITPAKYQ